MSDGHSRWTRHHNISRNSGVGVSLRLAFGELSTLTQRPSPLTCATLPSADSRLSKSISSSLGRPWSTMDCMSRHTIFASSDCHHSQIPQGASMILPTSLPSAQFSRQTPSSASQLLSHLMKTSSRVTPASPALARTLKHAGFDLYGLEDCDAAWFAWRAQWWKLRGRARSVAIRVSKARKR